MVVFHYDPDPFHMDQWLYLVHLFGVEGRVLSVPEGVTLHRYVSALTSLSELTVPLVRVDLAGSTPLHQHTYIPDAAYVFGPDDWEWTPSVSFAATVSITTPVAESMYACQAGAIVLYDRMIRG